MPRKKQIIKVKKTQKQKQKVNVVVNVNSNNKKKNVVSRQPKMIQSSAPQVIYIQTPQSASSNVNDRFSVPSASPHINEKVLDKAPPPPTAAIKRRPKTTTRGVALLSKLLSDLPPAVSDEEEAKTPVLANKRLTDLDLHPSINPIHITYEDWERPSTKVISNDLIKSFKDSHEKTTTLRGKKVIEDLFDMQELKAPRNKAAFNIAIDRFNKKRIQTIQEGKMGNRST
jgi:hypothetical protein